MKIGCCLGMNAVTEPRIGHEAIPLMAELGFDYVELPLAQLMELSEKSFQELLNRIKTSGIPVDANNNFFPASVRLTGENADLNKALDYAKHAVQRTAAMGAKIIVLGSTGAKNIPLGFPYERAMDQLLELLSKLQDLVQPAGITVALEAINSQESNFIISVTEAHNIVKKLSLENIKLLADYYHMRMENEDQKIILNTGKDLRHIHIAAKNGRLFPLPNDNEDYKKFFALLKNTGYNGRISIEAFSKNLAKDSAESLKYLRSYQ